MKTVSLVLVALLLSAPLGAEERKPLLHGALAASMVLHGMDVGTSLYRFGQDPVRFQEANPLLRPFQTQPATFGGLKMGLAAGINWWLVTQHRAHPKAVLGALLVQNALLLGVVAHNARLPK